MFVPLKKFITCVCCKYVTEYLCNINIYVDNDLFYVCVIVVTELNFAKFLDYLKLFYL